MLLCLLTTTSFLQHPLTHSTPLFMQIRQPIPAIMDDAAPDRRPSTWLPNVLGLTRHPGAARRAAATTLSDSQLWIATQLVDYAWLTLVAGVVSLLFGTHRGTAAAAAACTALGFASVAILQYRETCHFWLLSHKIPRCKLRPLPRKSHWFIFQTAAASMLSYFVMHQLAIVYFTPPALTLSFCISIFGPFYALLALRDLCFLGPLHPLLHRPRWYRLHRLQLQ